MNSQSLTIAHQPDAAPQTTLSNCIRISDGNADDGSSDLMVIRLDCGKRPIRVHLLSNSCSATLAVAPDQARELAAALILQADAFDALNAVLQVAA